MKSLMAMDASALPLVFGEAERNRLEQLLDIDAAHAVTSFNEIPPRELARTELLISGWGVPPVDVAALQAMPSLRAIVHWGGAVGFIDPQAAARGVAVSSARAANAVPVAEFTVAVITLAAKDAFWVSRQYCAEQRFIDREKELAHTGLYGTPVGIVGASSIGSLVIEMLRGYAVDVRVFDPYFTAQAAASLGVDRAPDLIALASRSRILSVHAPELPATREMISREVLAALPDGATLINTSRGSLVDQDALVQELRAGRLRAVLDVTDPDVLPAGHPLYDLPNVFLTPHLAGSSGNELRRLGAAALAEVERFAAGLPFQHPMQP